MTHSLRRIPFNLFMSLAAIALPCLAVEATAKEAMVVVSDSTAAEAAAIEVLRSEASTEKKASACKQLTVHGSATSVPVLCELLSDPQLNSWARIALEAIPGENVDTALCDSLSDLEGLQRIGVINSLGARRSECAIEPLVALLQSDEAVAARAALSLGKIGGEQAAEALIASLASSQFPSVRTEAAEGCLLCAERQFANGDSERALQLYEKVLASNLPQPKLLAARRGAILTDAAGGLVRLKETLMAEDVKVFHLGLTTARELTTAGVAPLLVEFARQSPANRQALLLGIAAHRGDSEVLPLALEMIASDDPTVRSKAALAIGAVGGADNLVLLIDHASQETDASVVQAVSNALRDLTGEKVDPSLIKLASQADGKSLRLILKAMGDRRMNAVPLLLERASSEDGSIREVVWQALGSTATPTEFPILITQLAERTSPIDRENITQALIRLGSRMPDPSAAIQQLAAAMATAPVEAKPPMIRVAASIQGPAALQLVASHANGESTTLQDAATAALGKWRTQDAGPVLLGIAKQPGHRYAIRALRGYIRIAKQFVLTPEERLAMCEAAIEVASRDAETELILQSLKNHPSIELLQLIDKSKHKNDFLTAMPTMARDLVKQDPKKKEAVEAALANLGVAMPSLISVEQGE